VDYKDKGHKVELLPEEELDGQKVQCLLVTLDTGNLFLYYLNSETFRPVQTEGRIFLDEAQMDSVSLYSDYREVDGLLFPYALETRLKSQTEGRKMTVEKIELNPDIDDSRFAFPGGDPTPTSP
jgi:hypothetical protein